LQIFELGVLFALMGWVSDSIWATIAGTFGTHLRGNARLAGSSRKVSGGVLIALDWLPHFLAQKLSSLAGPGLNRLVVKRPRSSPSQPRQSARTSPCGPSYPRFPALCPGNPRDSHSSQLNFGSVASIPRPDPVCRIVAVQRTTILSPRQSSRQRELHVGKRAQQLRVQGQKTLRARERRRRFR